MADLEAAVAAVVGADHAKAGPAGLTVRPASTEEVSAVLRVATEHSATVLPVGAGHTVGWLPAPRTDLRVDLRRMGAVLEHSAGDLVVHVQAGALIEDVQAAVGAAGQRLALHPPMGGVTVGGTVNADLSGPERYLHGTARDLLIGTISVRGDGAVTHSGGKVVKNVAGYDLGKLYSGSRGTLGVLTSAWFRLHPLPECTRWVVAAKADATAVGHAVAAVRNTQTAPTAIEVRRDHEQTVAVQLDGVAAGIDVRADAVAGLIGGAVLDTAPAGWGTWPPEEVLLALTHSPAALAEVLGALPDVALTGSAVGVLRVGCSVVEAPSVLATARSVCGRHHGSAVVARAPEGHGLDVWGGSDPALLALMRRVKDEFDPAGTLSPGRLLGGI